MSSKKIILVFASIWIGLFLLLAGQILKEINRKDNYNPTVVVRHLLPKH